MKMSRIGYFALLVLALVAIPSVIAAGTDYKVVATWKLGGEGGWDYLTVDHDGHRLFVTRSTRVMVVDTDSGKQVGEIPDTPGVHGMALVPAVGRGFTSNGREDMVSVFDLKTLKVEKKIKVGNVPDAIVYEPFSQRVFTFNARSHDATAIDSAKNAVAGTIELGGKPEYAASDEKGTMWVNIEDTSELVAFDPMKLAVKSRWKLSDCEDPTGLAIDRKSRRLFVGCGNKKMAIVDADSGKIMDSPAIGEGCDGTAFDPDLGLAFASAGDGTITVIREESADKFTVAQTLKTQKGARTMALDPKSHKIYTITTAGEPASFVVLVVEGSH